MTLNEFISTYNGNYIDFDGSYGAQCVDLMRQYIYDVVGISGYSIPPAPYARNLFERFPDCGDKNFIKIKNTPSGVPQKGDIIFWGWKWPTTGYAGHVAIYCDGNVNRFISFDQNYPTGATSRYYNHTYRGVLGWLRPRKAIK